MNIWKRDEHVYEIDPAVGWIKKGGVKPELPSRGSVSRNGIHSINLLGGNIDGL